MRQERFPATRPAPRTRADRAALRQATAPRPHRPASGCRPRPVWRRGRTAPAPRSRISVRRRRPRAPRSRPARQPRPSRLAPGARLHFPAPGSSPKPSPRPASRSWTAQPARGLRTRRPPTGSKGRRVRQPVSPRWPRSPCRRSRPGARSRLRSSGPASRPPQAQARLRLRPDVRRESPRTARRRATTTSPRHRTARRECRLAPWAARRAWDRPLSAPARERWANSASHPRPAENRAGR